MDLSKYLVIALIYTYFFANYVVHNDNYYELAEAHINQLQRELIPVRTALENKVAIKLKVK
ncbi:hypothetical protein DXX93_15455 [Thalassotalea euphylliae]|uniref:Uncharacterized protein n=1 Tax=Thalassotalea euphylliae TaxID=1655234 RepID=A0A3E0TT29_9GAMM|nr:hypothetical protein DXX93_15455 [Thalassotalea euphylliae]